MRILTLFSLFFLFAITTQAQLVLYRADFIHTVSGNSIVNGEMLVNGARIVSVGKNIANKPVGTLVVDLKGMQLYPGLIAATTSLGLTEIIFITLCGVDFILQLINFLFNPCRVHI